MYSAAWLIEFLACYVSRIVFVIFTGLTLATAAMLGTWGVLEGNLTLRLLAAAAPWLLFLLLHDLAFFGLKASSPPQPYDFDETNNIRGILWLIVVGWQLTFMFAKQFTREHIIAEDPYEK